MHTKPTKEEPVKPVNFNVKRQGDKFLIVTDQGLLVYPATSPAKAVAVLEFLEDAATPYRKGCPSVDR